MIHDLQKLAEYDAWANGEMLRSVTGPDPEKLAQGRLLAILAHIGGAKLVWLDRIAHGHTAVEVWPVLDWHGAATQLRRADERLLELTARLTMREMTQPVMYQNTRGESFTNPLSDVLVHVVNHGTYHRGQVALLTKAAGGQPAVTDYIAWVRQGGSRGRIPG